MGASNRGLSALVFLIAVLLIGAGITVICLIRYNLASVFWVCPYYYYWWCYTTTLACLIGDDFSDNSNCYYGYSIGAVGIFWAAFFFCTRARESTIAAVVELVIALCSLGWWIAGAVVMTQQSQLSDDKDFPNPTYRDGVVAVCWTAVGLSGVVAVLALMSCMAQRRRGREGKHHDHHGGSAPPMTETYAPTPAPPQQQPLYAPPPVQGGYAAGGQPAYQVSYPPPAR